jgi:hypothetical protein
MGPGEHNSWKQKQLFIVVSVLYFVYWVIFCVHLARRWQSMDQNIHKDALGIPIYSLALWTLLQREKASGFTLVAACFVLIAATGLAFHLF